MQASRDAGLGSLTLEVGQFTIRIEVTAAPPLLENTQAQVNTSFSSSTLQTFPGLALNLGLDFLALQAPGVVNNRDLGSFANRNGVGFAVNGLRSRNNDQQIDGQNNNDNSVAGPAIVVTNPDFIQEYQIITSNFGPEYGRNAGSVVNIITKSGTNDWHGDLFVSEGNSRLDSLTNVQKAFQGLHSVPSFNNEYSGVSIGGPLKKDRAFIFGGFDDNIIPGSSVYSTGSFTPTPAGLTQLAACFPNSPSIAALATYGPYGIKGGNPIPNGTPRTGSLLAPNGSRCAVEFDGVQRTLSTPAHQYDYTTRLDWNGNKDRVSGRWLYQKITQMNLGPDAAIGYPYNIPSFGEDFGVSWTRMLSPAMVNEARLSYGRFDVEFGGNGIGNTIPHQGSLATALTTVGIAAPFIGFGPTNSLPNGRIVNTYQFQDNWSYFRSAHQFKAGMNLTYQRSPNVFLPAYNGAFNFSATATGSAFQNFANDVPSSIRITSGSPTLDFREHDSFFYVGDDYRVRPNLTLNLGLTYTYFGQPANLFHRQDVARESGSTPFFDPSLPLSVRAFPLIPAPKTQFGPSVGFAYSPHWGGRPTDNGKTVLRGGYRMSYDPIFYNIYLGIATAAPQLLQQTLTGSRAAANPLLAQPFGPAVRNELAPYLALGVSDPRSFTQTNVTPDFRADHVHQWTFGIQRQIVPNAVVEVRYVGNHGANLFQSINGNPFVAGIASFPNALPSGVTPCPSSQAVVSTAIGRVNCNQGVVRTRTNTGVSDYQGLQTELRLTNLARQLTLRAAYTWSKTTSNADEIAGTNAAGNTIAFSQNPLSYVGPEHGLSGLDFPHNWTLSFVEQIPIFRAQRGIRGRILGGWSAAGTYLISSGQPYTPIQSGLNSGSGGNVDDIAFNTTFTGLSDVVRPFMGSPTAPVSSVGMYAADACAILGFSTCPLAANQLVSVNQINITGELLPVTKNQVRFIVNGPQANLIYGTPFGNAGRNILRDYHTNTANFSLFKETSVTERLRVRFSVEMLNVFNHNSFNSVDPFLDDAGLAQLGTGFATPSLFPGVPNTTAAFGSRIINFQLKIFF